MDSPLPPFGLPARLLLWLSLSLSPSLCARCPVRRSQRARGPVPSPGSACWRRVVSPWTQSRPTPSTRAPCGTCSRYYVCLGHGHGHGCVRSAFALTSGLSKVEQPLCSFACAFLCSPERVAQGEVHQLCEGAEASTLGQVSRGLGGGCGCEVGGWGVGEGACSLALLRPRIPPAAYAHVLARQQCPSLSLCTFSLPLLVMLLWPLGHMGL
jgi:hypothetical protein